MPKKLTKKDRDAALERIAEEVRHCSACQVDKVGVAVPGEGSSSARVLFLGEAPGKEEAKTGRPFIGRSGKVLRALIKEAGLTEAEVFITSPVKYLPVHVTPTVQEVEHGRIHLAQQLDVIQPKIIVLLGKTACLALLHRKVAIAKEHGTMIEQDGRRYLIAYHPAAALYYPPVRAELVKDFKKLKKIVAMK